MRSGKRLLLIAAALLVLGLGGFGIFWLMNSGQQTPQSAPTSSAPTTPKDTTPPTVSLDGAQATAPLTGTVTITVDAKDNVSVSRVEYFIDDTFFGVTYALPFSLELDTTKLTAGTHTIVAKAYDAAGNHTDSQALTIAVGEQPTVTAGQPAASSSSRRSTATTASAPASSGGTSNSSPSDTAAPSAPSNLNLSADGAYIVKATWTASTDNTGVSSYTVYRDGAVLGTTTSTAYTDYTVVPGNTYDYKVVASDAANNTATSTEPSVTLATTNIWMPFDTPATFGNDGVPLELGVKFQPRVNGKITGVRFYKASGDPGIHTGTLWQEDGTLITNAVFSNETASGWQEVTFATPVDVTANTTYVASYTSPNGRYGATTDYFESAGITSEYLTSPKSGGPSGTNGVFSTTGGAFPTQSFDETNYWVDVAFTPNPAAGGPTPTLADSAQTFSGFPGSDNTGVVGKRLPRRDRIDLVDGITVSGVEIESDFIAVKVNNVTFDDVKLTYTGPLNGSFTLVNIQVGVTGTKFTDCEVDGKSNVERAIYGIDGVDVRRCNIHHAGNAIEVSNRITAHDNYIHDIFTPNGMVWHTDGIQTASTANDLSIVHNTIFLTSNETGAVNFVGSGLGSGDSMTNVDISNNLMAGGGYTVYVGADTNTNVNVTNNKFSTRYHPTVGAFNIYYPTFLPGVTVSGNTIYETGAPADTNF